MAVTSHDPSVMLEHAALVVATLEGIGAAAIAVTPDSRIIGTNKRFDELLGAEHEAGEDSGRALRRVSGLVLRPEEWSAFVETVLQDCRQPRESLLEFYDGRVFKVHMRPLHWQGQVAGRVWTWLDMTAEHRVTGQLQVSEERLHLAVSGARGAIWDWHIADPTQDVGGDEDDGGEYYLSPDIKAIAGYRDDEIPNTRAAWFHLVHRDDREMVRNRLRDAVARGGGARILEYRIRHRDGGIRWIRSHGTLVNDDSGRLLRWTGIEWDITEQKLAEIGLEAEHARVRAYLDTAEIFLVVLDSQGRIAFINPKGCRVLGADEADLIGRSWFDVALTEDWRSSMQDMFEQCMAGRVSDVSQFEHPVCTAAKQERLISWRSRMVPDHNSTEPSLLMCGEDITDQRAMEFALRDSEQTFAAVFQTSPDAILMVVRDSGRCIDVNPAFESLTGVSREGAVGADIFRHIGLGAVPVDGYAPRDESLLARLRDESPLRNLDCRFVTANGEERTVLLSASVFPLHEEDALLLTLHDISERIATEAALKASEHRFRSYFDQELIGIAMTRMDGTWLDANAALCKLLGRDKDDLMRLPWPELVVPQDLSREVELLDDVRQGERDRYSIEKRMLHADGQTIHVLASVAAVRDSKGYVDYLISVVQDITVQKLQAEQLSQAQKMEAVGQLTGGIAHDFNNLLTIIGGNLELLQLALGEDDPDHALIEDALSAARDGRELTRQMLIFSRGRTLESQATDVAALIRNIERLLRRALRDDIVLTLGFGPDDAMWARLDQHQFESVLVNLMLNARDAIPGSGEVRVELETAEPTTVLHLDLPAGEYVHVMVSDSGGGMSPEVIAKACEPFFTTKELGRGTGLGLSMAYTFLRQSGGMLWLESALGQGSVVHMVLPAAKAEQAASQQAPARVAPPRGDERILVVEDEPRLRALAVRYLQDLGYQVAAAANGQEALALLESDSGFDLLFSDIMMPGGINGHQLADIVRSARPHMPILLTTGYDGAADSVRAGGAAWPLLHKPYGKAQLATYIRRCFDGKAEDDAS